MRAATEIPLWWLALTGLWTLTLSTPSAPELIAGASAAAVCAIAARSARRAMNGTWQFKAGWLAWLTPLPKAAVSESVAALRAVFPRPSAGKCAKVPVPAEPRAQHEARLAVATVVIGCTPGTMVVASPPDDTDIVVHRLLPDSPALDRVTR
ncbi:Na+/H+ antiporter subunit E [Amycolatopsis dendrobii]|uniref:Na+/H+ antiporter subunit E n=1 Tax=Amycolatopsis dendrobii TaxID=2760662 RepID=A0A7W3ZC49_9PSEU|nr:Na+/H+ antiporter subunit E [Amycolatopsis dendrobii]MBB1156191.1 Na+/H+ antiporter subunit E [Amycolatopsis dendrobii]